MRLVLQVVTFLERVSVKEDEEGGLNPSLLAIVKIN